MVYNSKLDYDLLMYEKPAKSRKAALDKEPKVVRRYSAKRNHIPFSYFMSAVVFVALTVLMITSYVRLNEVTFTQQQLKGELEKLLTEQQYMKVKIEEKITIKNVEQYAKINLNMSKIDKNRVEYIKISDENRSEVLSDIAENEKSSFFFAGLIKNYNAIVEYLR